MKDTASQIHWTFPANQAGSQDACARCEAWIIARGLPQRMAFRALLILEELFTNTVKYGGPAAAAGGVRITLEAREAGVVLRYGDRGAAFDPLHTAPVASATGNAIGGQGLRIIQSLVQHTLYRREDGWNLLEMTINGDADAR